MQVQAQIETKLRQALPLAFLEVVNESHMHSGPATESHFKLTVVSEAFSGVPPVRRHQQVYAVLAQELQNGVHALALHLYTPEQWQATQQQSPQSPNCRGGSRTS